MDINAIIAALGAAGTALAAVLTKFVIPLMEAKRAAAQSTADKAKAEAEKTTFDSWVEKARQFVTAAQQKTDLVTNEQMATYVQTCLKAIGIPDSFIDALHEAGVFAMKAEKAAGSALDTIQTEVDNALEGGMDDATAEDDTEAHSAADKLARLTKIAQAAEIDTTGMDAAAIVEAINAKVAA
jgi:hypothetical protein